MARNTQNLCSPWLQKDGYKIRADELCCAEIFYVQWTLNDFNRNRSYTV